MEWWCWFFEQETQSLSFGGGSGGSHPLGSLKERGGGGLVSLSISLHSAMLRAKGEKQSRERVVRGQGREDRVWGGTRLPVKKKGSGSV